MASWYEKWCKKNNEKAKKDYVTISRLEFLDTISSTIASLDRVREGNAQQKGEMMTNREKNKKRFDELGIGDLPDRKIAHRIAVRKNGDVDLCVLTPCHDCIFKRGHCTEDAKKWLTDEAEPDKPAPEKKEEKMERDKIKVGDTVKVTEAPVLKGKTGIVRRIYCTNNGKPYVVNFDKKFCWTFSDHEIVKVKSKKTPPCIVVYRDGDTVTVKDLETGEEASAVCSKKDTFDIHTGAFIAMSRLTHFDTDIRLMWLEIEQIESYISDIKMRFGALMGEGYKYPDFDEEEEE